MGTTRSLPSQKEAAELLEVTPRTLRDWKKVPGFPDCSRGYDVDAIRKWIELHERKGSKNAADAAQVKIARDTHRARREKLLADRLEREEAAARGDILPRAELEVSIREIIQLARDRFVSLPKELARDVPKAHRKRLIEEGGKRVRAILGDFARSLERHQPTKQPETSH